MIFEKTGNTTTTKRRIYKAALRRSCAALKIETLIGSNSGMGAGGQKYIKIGTSFMDCPQESRTMNIGKPKRRKKEKHSNWCGVGHGIP